MYCKQRLLFLVSLALFSLTACTQEKKDVEGPKAELPKTQVKLKPKESPKKSRPVTPTAKREFVPELPQRAKSVAPETTSASLASPETPPQPNPRSEPIVEKNQDAETYLIQGGPSTEKDRVLKSYFLYAEGRRALKSKKYDEAIQLFNKTIKLNAKYADGYYYRGLAYLLSDQTDLAERDYQSALRLSPKLASRTKFGDVIFEQAETKIESGADATGIAKLASFAKKFKTKQKLSDLARLIFQRAIQRANARDDIRALADFQVGLSLDASLSQQRELATVFDRRGFDLMKQDRFALAKQCFEKSLKVNPDYQPAKIHLSEVQSYLKKDVQGLPTNLKETVAYLKSKTLTDRNYLRYMPMLVKAYNETSGAKLSFKANYPFKKGQSRAPNKLEIENRTITIPLFQSINAPLEAKKATAWEKDFQILSQRFCKAASRAAELNFARNEIFIAWEHAKGAVFLSDESNRKDAVSLQNQVIDRMRKLIKDKGIARYYSRFPTLKKAVEKRERDLNRKAAPKAKKELPPPPDNEYELFIVFGVLIAVLVLVYLLTSIGKGKKVKKFAEKMEGKSEKVDHLGAYEQWKTKGSQYNQSSGDEA